MKLYCLTNVIDAWLVRDLTASEASAIVAVLNARQRLTTRAWTEGWPAWKPIDDPDCAFLLETRKQTQEPPTIDFVSNDPPEITQVYLPPDRPTASGRIQILRRHERFPLQIEVLVQTSSLQFKTMTEDVSEGGIRIREVLPDEFAGYCQIVFLPGTSRSLTVLANPVEDQSKGRFHLEFVDDKEQARFAEWFKNQNWSQTA